MCRIAGGCFDSSPSLTAEHMTEACHRFGVGVCERVVVCIMASVCVWLHGTHYIKIHIYGCGSRYVGLCAWCMGCAVCVCVLSSTALGGDMCGLLGGGVC